MLVRDIRAFLPPYLLCSLPSFYCCICCRWEFNYSVFFRPSDQFMCLGKIVSKETWEKFYLSPCRTKIMIPFDHLSHCICLFLKCEICSETSIILNTRFNALMISLEFNMVYKYLLEIISKFIFLMKFMFWYVSIFFVIERLFETSSLYSASWPQALSLTKTALLYLHAFVTWRDAMKDS